MSLALDVALALAVLNLAFALVLLYSLCRAAHIGDVKTEHALEEESTKP